MCIYTFVSCSSIKQAKVLFKSAWKSRLSLIYIKILVQKYGNNYHAIKKNMCKYNELKCKEIG